MGTATSRFRYELPEAAIAQQPVEPRDAARLLDTRSMTDRLFRDLPWLLDPGDLVVLNRTRVRRARLRGVKETTGGRVELLLLGPTAAGTWSALARPGKGLREGTSIVLDGMEATVTGVPGGGVVEVRFSGPDDVEDFVERTGTMPYPPYITTGPSDPDRYQTVFGDRIGSAAAPTASLHFTDGVLAELRRREIALAFVELQVGLATFRPILADEVEGHTMHEERIDVGEAAVEAVRACRRRGGKVVAVGTTVVRTLESVADGHGAITPFSGTTGLYVTPGFTFQVVDRLVTNFHQPGSSLLVMLAAFMGDRWREVYQQALARGYRFLSFGDAMLAERAT